MTCSPTVMRTLPPSSNWMRTGVPGMRNAPGADCSSRARRTSSPSGVYVIEGMESGNRIAFVDLGGSLGYVETTPDGELVRRARLEESAPGEFRLPGAPVRIHFDDAGRVRMTVGEQVMQLISVN